MGRRWRVLLALAASAFLAWCLIWLGVRYLSWREHPDRTTGVAITLGPERQVILAGEMPDLVATLRNDGAADVVLVEPGDGSREGWRTPLIEWSGIPGWPSTGRCGNINSLKADEVFPLKVGETRRLRGWFSPILFLPGTYRIAVRYTNSPKMARRGLPLDEDDPGAREALRDSTPVTTVSNEVEVVVLAAPKRPALIP